ncbi:hypothetical protein [Streptomyces bambusae]|uniref:hypothetical protein n=1 Tax=Streptomyces bambusae TaxID=1550616 RepID=UPI0035ABA4D1
MADEPRPPRGEGLAPRGGTAACGGRAPADHAAALAGEPTAAGRAAVARIGPGHAALAERLAAELGEEAFAETVRVLERLTAALDAVHDGANGDASGG